MMVSVLVQLEHAAHGRFARTDLGKRRAGDLSDLVKHGF
jgi:hypothetical protein